MDRGQGDKDMNITASIVARLSSSRLPKKQLKKIGNKRLIDWTIENVKKSRYVDKIVIATTDDEENRPFVDVAKELGVDIFLYDGDINDVVGRLTQAAVEFDADIPILISGDCPLIWAESMDKLIEKILEDSELDAVDFCFKNGKFVIHEGMSVYRKKCWLLADELSDKPNLREHQFPIIGLKPELFKTDCIHDDDLFYRIKHRVSVDTLADLEFMRAVYQKLVGMKKEFDMPDVVELLLKKPQLMQINKDVHQIKINEKQKKALFVVKGLENLELFFDFAYELTKKGVGVRFLVENDESKDIVENKGFNVADGDTKREKFNFVIEENRIGSYGFFDRF
ncbi:MAG: hypothetical protein IEMM0003_0571 [bacterium]|nr:MAG: hypothetical protein IEMM0003_0571 [bacterium]